MLLDADREGQAVLAAIAARRDIPSPTCVVHTSPNRLHVLWRVTGFSKEGVEALQRHLAVDLGTDKAAVSCSQLTRLPGFLNHKYRPGAVVSAEYMSVRRAFSVEDFSCDQHPSDCATRTARVKPARTAVTDACERARRYIAAIPPAVAGNQGDTVTFRVCCRLVRGFALSDDDALSALEEWNRQCVPPWSLADLRSKLAAARLYGREPVGSLLGRQAGQRCRPG
ncbi:DNA-primase RepB domain-containing protein [Luteitalea sp.]